MTDARTRRLTLPTDAHGRLLVGYSAASLLPVALFLVMLVGSLLLSGAQVLPDAPARYDAAVPFPLFVVADWLAIGCAVIAALLVVPVALTTRVVQATHLIGVLAYTLAAIVADLYFAFAYPGEGTPFASPTDPGVTLGLHLIGSMLGVLCAVVLGVRLAVIGPRYERLRKAGDLPIGSH